MIHKQYQKNITKLTYLFIYKHVKANMLGYDTHLDYFSSHSKKNIQCILENIIIDLSNRCNIELSVLSSLKNKCEHDSHLYIWDIPFYINKWKIAYGITDEIIQPYFEINNTLMGIFDILSSLFYFSFA